MKKSYFILPVLFLIYLCVLPMQLLADESASKQESTFSQAELDQMLAPIALYPDSLLSQIFMASTYPGQAAEAVKWSKDNPGQEGDKAVTAVQDKSWDPSVMSLVAFPQVLEMMGKNPDWVQDLGDAFLAEPETVMDSVQTLRKKAKDEGNLKTTSEQKVIIEPASPDIIIIEPADPQIVYVPTYNPTVVYGSWWYPSYPPYYYHPVGTAIVAGISFGIGVGIVNSLWGGCNWGRGRGSVDINVNRYNNINVGNKIGGGNNRSNWNHNSRNRGSTPYRDKGSRSKYANKRGASSRQDFRGRDNTRNAERQRAQESLKKRGNDPASARKKLSGSGGDKVRNQVNKVDHKQSRNRSNSIAANSSNKRSNNFNSGSRNNSSTRNKTTTRDKTRSSQSSQNRSRNSSLSGIKNSGRSSSNYNRGSRSRSSFNSGGSRSRGGGGRGGRR
ncbi:MAG: DUF3300 domain-containing protein [gamma proteobacterium symbiont of Taylorina sp.]|nr:DUF3300 domain-containing protein [gamma proteobacterium symbiont of Taylorina sp.]